MTDKNLNQDECTLAVKASRSHSLHQIPSQPVMASPRGGYPIPPDVVHHSHLSYRMLQPSFQMPHALNLSAPMSGPNARTGQISNDLGPPIFMPPLNLGTPKPSITFSAPTSKQSQIVSLSSSSSTTTTPPSLNPSHLDGTTSSNVLTSYPNLLTPSGNPYHSSAMLHSAQSSFNTQPTNSAISKAQSLSKTGMSLNSIRMTSQESEGQIKGHPTTCTSNAIVKNSKHAINSNTSVSSIGIYTPNNIIGHTKAVTTQTGSMNMIKQSKTGGMADMPTNYVTPSGHYQQMQSNKMYTKIVKDGTTGFESSINRNKTDISEIPMTSGGTGSGNVLVCTEGLPPPVPRNIISTSSSDLKYDRSHTGNHITESHHITSLQGMTVHDSQIPWPEAVSKNIIIPAPNLTGKDIANLTSASSSPIATNDRTGGNDILWIPLSDHHSDNQQLTQSSMDSSTTSNSSLGSYMTPHESGYAQAGSNSAGLGMCLLSQASVAASSPRPSILRKRGYDGRPIETISSPSSPGMHKLLRQRSRGSPCELGDNHFVREDISSPRKRPRKQHLYIDSINEHNFQSHNSQEEDTTLLTETNSHNSMIANERLLGPLPLKEKKQHQINMEEIMTKIDSNKHEKGTNDVIYMSQLRRSQFPIVQLCRNNRHTARNHFRRHADIKHLEDDSIPLHELCSQSSTWLRSSGWKLQHFSSQLEKMETYDSDVLVVMERLKDTCDSVLNTMSEIQLEEKHRKFLTETMMGNIERIKRARLHTQETRDSMTKILDVNGKAIDIMKRFATQLPTKLLTTSSTSIIDHDTNYTTLQQQ